MNILTIDFETYWAQDFSLSKITTEEYVRSERFQIIGMGIKLNEGETAWLSGTEDELREYLHENYDWPNTFVLAHNTMFDGAILSWRLGITPKGWLDTMCMGRALHGVESSASLKAMAERYGIGEKGTEVLDAKGKYLDDFTEEELARYGDYCINDVELTYKLFKLMMNNFPMKELKVIDLTLSMFTHPILELDKDMLEEHLAQVKMRKEMLLAEAGVSKDDLMSNPKFAELLTSLGVKPPMKESARTGKETFAFAKTDEGFKALQEHDDDRVQALVEARLGNKSTLEETRTERFIAIAERGNLPVPIRYYAAHTGRWGGADKINLQNLPSRGPNAKALKKSIVAPAGYMVVEADSSQIEARVLAWLAGQEDLVTAFTNKEDVYKIMASSIYGVSVDEVTKEQRFVGKTTILGAGYGMGANRFQEQLKGMGVELELDECRRIIAVYRTTYPNIKQLWYQANDMLNLMLNKQPSVLGVRGDDVLCPQYEPPAVRLPSGLLLRYDGLKYDPDTGEYSYKTRNGRTRIYGGKVVENVCQAIARCIIAEQMLRINKRYKVVFTVHDSVGCCVPEAEAEDALAYVEECMRYVPKWAAGMPIDCEASFAKSYGDCE